jgi:hypothetical protein
VFCECTGGDDLDLLLASHELTSESLHSNLPNMLLPVYIPCGSAPVATATGNLQLSSLLIFVRLLV